MNIALWIAQGLLAAVYLTAGLMKLTRPHQRLVEMTGWPEDFSESTIKLSGLAETLAPSASSCREWSTSPRY